MIIKTEKINEEFNRDTYWSRIHIKEKDSSKKATILVCASWEYLSDFYGVVNITDEQVSEWYNKVVDYWAKKGDNVFKKAIYYDVYANTEEGKINGFNFLKEIRP